MSDFHNLSCMCYGTSLLSISYYSTAYHCLQMNNTGYTQKTEGNGNETYIDIFIAALNIAYNT